jgi:hypothetical protein
MAPYPNLVSDSTLVQETIDLLRDCGGRANAAEIVDAVFKVSHIDDELAGLLVADLVKDDRRFTLMAVRSNSNMTMLNLAYWTNSISSSSIWKPLARRCLPIE